MEEGHKKKMPHILQLRGARLKEFGQIPKKSIKHYLENVNKRKCPVVEHRALTKQRKEREPPVRQHNSGSG